jgi:hypothetical protein
MILFPLDTLTFSIRCKTIRDFINSLYDGFKHDKALEYGGCDCNSRRRIDHRKLTNNTLLCIETDENELKNSNKKEEEEDRYSDVFMTFSCKYIFIRFNSDQFTNKKGKICNTHISKRFETLKKLLI